MEALNSIRVFCERCELELGCCESWGEAEYVAANHVHDDTKMVEGRVNEF